MESSEPLIDDLPGSPTLLSLNGREEATNSENILEEEEDEKGSEKKTDNEATDLEYNRVERPFSPVSSVLSMQTNHSSNHDHPNLRTQPMESRYQPCDVCSDGRVRAVKSCLTCCALYCEAHIKDHYNECELQKHKLVDITGSDVAKHLSVSVETEQGETQSSVTDAQALHQNSWEQEWKTGRRPARKSATGNTVLGKWEFNGGFSPVSGTSECEAHSAEVEEERRMEETERKIGEEEKIKRRKLERYINAEEESLQPRPESSGGHLPSPESSRGRLLRPVPPFPSTLQSPIMSPFQSPLMSPIQTPLVPPIQSPLVPPIQSPPCTFPPPLFPYPSPYPGQYLSPHPDQYPSPQPDRLLPPLPLPDSIQYPRPHLDRFPSPHPDQYPSPHPDRLLPLPQLPDRLLPLPQLPDRLLPLPQLPDRLLPLPQLPDRLLPLPQLPDRLLPLPQLPDPGQYPRPHPDRFPSPFPCQYPSLGMERVPPIQSPLVQREQAERRNREERMEALRGVQMSTIKMRYKIQKSFLKKFFKLPDPGMLNLQDAENMLEESEKEIKAWQEMQMENLERRIRAEMEELERKIREEERERRQELEKSLRAEMEELERKIREEERERRQELEQSLRAEMEKWREELEKDKGGIEGKEAGARTKAQSRLDLCFRVP